MVLVIGGGSVCEIKNIWSTLTEEQKENLEKEYRALNAWDEEQRRKRKEELIAQGKWRGNL